MRRALAIAILSLCGCADAYAPEAVRETVTAEAAASDMKAATARKDAEQRGADRAKADLSWAAAQDVRAEEHQVKQASKDK